MNLLCIDTETTGLIPGEDKVTELGLVLYNVEDDRMVAVHNMLIRRPGLEIPEIITRLTGITSNILEDSGSSVNTVVGTLTCMLSKADYLVGHNIREFDKPFIDALAAEANIKLPDIPMIDTRTDLHHPVEPKSHKLENLLMDQELLNYFPHSAIGDTLMTLKLLCKFDLAQTIEMSKVPDIKVQAVVSYANKDKAKGRGFHWDAKEKIWHTTMKENKYRPEDFDFKTQVL